MLHLIITYPSKGAQQYPVPARKRESFFFSPEIFFFLPGSYFPFLLQKSSSVFFPGNFFFLLLVQILNTFLLDPLELTFDTV